jgi:ATP-dependent protease ClpP protease subunit
MSEETLLERLIPGDLEHTIPAKLQEVLPGGFRNRFVQFALGLLVTFGFAFVVRRMLEKREALRALARPPAPPAIAASASAPPQAAPVPAEPAAPVAIAAPMIEASQSQPAPANRAVRYPLLGQPHVHLSGPVDQAMYASFRDQLAAAPRDGTLVIAISTLGGDPEVARLMGDEVRLLREYNNREILFLGKVAVYSAGATFMAAFPVDKRFLTRGTRIMIHERIMTSTIHLSGPLKSLTSTIKAKLHEIEHSVQIEEEGFRELVAGSRIAFEEVCRRAPSNWYIHAEEARDLGLVLDVI